jgi:DNA modification methylase
MAPLLPNVNDVVVDYFGGSGTTLIASKELDRNCIIFEKSTTYVEVAQTRLINESNPDDLLVDQKNFTLKIIL